MRKRWYIFPLSDKRHALAERLGISVVTAQLLINRDITDAAGGRMMMEPTMRSLHDPSLLPDICKAVERVKQAVREREHIMLCGDYDVDGVTSLAMFSSFFKNTPVTLTTYIPHRLKEGYGLKDTAIQEAIQKKVSLLICLDCGTNSYHQIEKALRHHIDVIVIDHHDVTTPHPGSILINPKRTDSAYPFKELCSGALAMKVIQAITGKNDPHMLDLAVLATVADVAPLIGENRIIVKEGIPHLQKTSNKGLIELMKKAGVKPEKISTFHIGYLLGPRINASGRISSAYESLRLLLEEDPVLAEGFAESLHKLNTERQRIGNDAFKKALAKIEQTVDFSKDYVIIADDDWHPGIIGIVAARITDMYHRPTFIISFRDGSRTGKGSGRSIQHFHITQALEECSSFLINYGGHEQAAGIEIDKDKLPAFRSALNALARERIERHHLIPQISIDYELAFKDITDPLIKEIDSLRPFGEGNPAPLFLTKKLACRTAPRKIENDKYSLYITDGQSVYEALVSGSSGLLTVLDTRAQFDCVYTLTRRVFDGHQQISLHIVDARSTAKD